MLALRSPSSQRKCHKQLSSSPSRKRRAAKPLWVAIEGYSGGMRIFRSPVAKLTPVSWNGGRHEPSNGASSAGVTRIYFCKLCNRLTTASIGESHHPRRLACWSRSQAASNPSSTTLDPCDPDGGSEMKGDSSAMRSGTCGCKKSHQSP